MGLLLLFSSTKTIYNNEEAYEPLVYAFRFQVATGIRPGELLGLKWEDISLEKEIVSLKRSINIQKEFTTGKNDNARRSFALLELTRSILLEHEKRNGRESEYVFSLNNTWIRPATYYKRWTKYRNYHNIREATPYCLRHTFISIVKMLPESMIRPLVGHSVNMNTYRVYGHEMHGDMQTTAARVQQEFNRLLPTQ